MAVSFDRAADYYDATRAFSPEVMRRIMSVLKKELKGSKCILDAGVGTGRFAKPLGDAGFEVVGIDISRRMLEKARQKGVNNLVLGDARYLPFKGKAFGSATSIHLLHLIAEWEDTLGEIARVAKGKLITVTEHHGDYAKTPNEVYRRIMKKYGYSYEHPGQGEWGLNERIRPTEKIVVARYRKNIEEGIRSIEKKVFSYQWKAPQNAHKKAIIELRKHFAKKKEIWSDVIVFVWDIDDIEDYLEGKKKGSLTPPPSQRAPRRRHR